MTTRRSGAIINVASTAAFQPIAHMAVYAATKAFVLSFTEALWDKPKPKGVRVIAICPGATDTLFFDVVGAEEASFGKRRAPGQVVATALRGLAHPGRDWGHIRPAGELRMARKVVFAVVWAIGLAVLESGSGNRNDLLAAALSYNDTSQLLCGSV